MENNYPSNEEEKFDYFIRESMKDIEKSSLSPERKKDLYLIINKEIRKHENKEMRKGRYKKLDDKIDVPVEQNGFVKRSEMCYAGECSKILDGIELFTKVEKDFEYEPKMNFYENLEAQKESVENLPYSKDTKKDILESLDFAGRMHEKRKKEFLDKIIYAVYISKN